MTITVDTGNITVATPQGNASSPQTFDHTCGANVDALVVVVTIYDTSASDGVVSGVKYNNVAFDTPAATLYYDALCDGHCSVWLLPSPITGGSYTVEVSFGGVVTDFEAAAIGIEGTIGTFDKDSNGTPATGTSGNLSITWNTVATNTIVFSASLDDQTDVGKVHPQEIEIYNVDVGDVVSAQYAIRTGSGSQTMTVVDDDGDEDWVIVGAGFYEVAAVPQINVSDGLTVGESVTVKLSDETLSVSDGLVLADTPQYYSDDILIGENVTLSVSVPGVPDRIISVGDGITIGETTSVELPDALALSVSDGLTVGESITVDVIRTLDVSDDIALGESTDAVLDDLAIDKADGLTLSETTAAAHDDETISVIDGLTIGEDNIEVAIGALDPQEIDVSDGITIGENVTTTLGDLTFSISDDLVIGEYTEVSIGAAGIFEISKSDNLTVGENVTLSLDDLNFSITDSLTIGEDITVTLGAVGAFEISVIDGLTLSENVTLSMSDLGMALTDNVTIADAANVLKTGGDLEIDLFDDVIFGELTYAEAYIAARGMKYNLHRTRYDKINAMGKPGKRYNKLRGRPWRG